MGSETIKIQHQLVKAFNGQGLILFHESPGHPRDRDCPHTPYHHVCNLVYSASWSTEPVLFVDWTL